MQCRKRFVTASAGNRSGKTRAAVTALLQRGYELRAQGHVNQVAGIGKDRRPAVHLLVCTPTFGMLSEPRRLTFEAAGDALVESWNRHEQDLWLKGDVLVSFRSGEDGGERLRGLRLHGVFVDELTTPGTEPGLWNEVLRARLADWAPHSFALFTTTPDNPTHWTYSELVRRGMPDDSSYHPDYASFGWPTSANPVIQTTEIEAAQETLPERSFRRLWLANWEAPSSSRVLDEFDDEIHVITEREAKLRYGISLSGRSLRSMAKAAAIGHDVGYAQPGAAIVLLDFGDELLVTEEVYEAHLHSFGDEHGRTWATVIRELANGWQANTVVVDSARPDVIDAFCRRGLNARGTDKSIKPGLTHIQTWLHPGPDGPRLRILDACTNLIREIKAASWLFDKRTGLYREEIDERIPSHALDSLRYCLVETVRHKPVTPQRFQNRTIMRRAGPFGVIRQRV